MTKDELKMYIKTILMNGTNKILSSRTTVSYLQKRGMYDILMSYYNDSQSLRETIYRILNDVDIVPTCKICGKTLKFCNGRFATYCSQACANKDPEVLKRNAENVSRSLKRAYKERGDEIKKKRANTLKDLYGIDHCSPFASKEIQDKAKQSIINHYGVENVFYLKEFRGDPKYWEKYSIEYQKKLGYNIEYIIDNENNRKIKVFNCCPIHGDVIMNLSTFANRTKIDRKDHTILCPICNPLRNPESSIETVIKNILIKHNINFIQHDHNQIKPYELDFYLPDYNLAIECNGVYWHSGHDNKKRHNYKYELCKDRNIKLLYFWEDQIINKLNVIEDILKSKLKLNFKVQARKCKIKILTYDIAFNFINENCIDEFIKAKTYIGLYYNDELYQIATFSNNKLIQLCSKCNYNVIGGLSKLINYYVKNYNINNLICNCNSDMFTCESFIKLFNDYKVKFKQRNLINNLRDFKCYSKIKQFNVNLI